MSKVINRMEKCISDILFILTESFNLYQLEDYITAFELIGQLVPKNDIHNIMRVYYDYHLDLNDIIELIDKDKIRDFCKVYTYLIQRLSDYLEVHCIHKVQIKKNKQVLSPLKVEKGK